MPIIDYLVLALAGTLAGALNALAGGGSFITIPALMFTGSTPILANTNSTVATWPGIVSSLLAYRRNLAGQKHPLVLYAAMALIGGSLGAVLLLFTSNRFFIALLPWLLLVATLLFVFGNKITAWATGNQKPGAVPPVGVSCSLLFLIAVYGGYFGGGMGIMTLAVFAVMGMQDIHEMNALKVLWTSMINGVAVIIFLAAGKIEWLRCLTMMAGAIAGGYATGIFAQYIPRIWLRRFIIAVAAGMTAYYFARNWMG